MKSHVFGSLLVLLTLTSETFGANRIFTDAKGRSIEGELVGFAERSSTVSIKRAGSRKPTSVPITVFAAEDQDFIRDWARMQIINDKRLKVKFSKSSKKDSNNTYATAASTEVYTDHVYNIELINGTNTRLDQLDLEYVVYYQQEHHIKRGSDIETKQGALYKKETITLPARQTTEIKSDPVKLYVWNTYSLASVDAKMLGIRLRLTLTSAGGETLSRDFAYPNSLDLAWRSDSENAQRRTRSR